MMMVEEITKGVSVIRARSGGLRMANTYILGEEKLLLVEPMCAGPIEGRWWIDQISRWAIEGRKVVGLVITHWHADHVIGADAIAGHFDLPVYAPVEGKEGRLFPNLNAVGDLVEVWRVLKTPGHAPEHICLFRDGVLIAGDMVSEGGAIVFDREAYDGSYRQLRELKPALVLPAHGRVTTELPS